MRNRARTPRRDDPSTKEHQAKKDAPKGQKTAKKFAAKKEAKPTKRPPSPPKKAANTDAAVPREFSKKAIVLDLMQRTGGATMAEIAEATDWQIHSIRGFISGTITKKMGLKVETPITRRASGPTGSQSRVSRNPRAARYAGRHFCLGATVCWQANAQDATH